jgi:hypothetical protein
MVEYRRRIALSATRKDIEAYNPPQGINLQCWEFDDYTKTVLTQMVCNSETPTVAERRTLQDIDNELSKLKIAYDRVRNRPNHLDRQQMRFECNLDELNGELDKLRRTSSNKSQHGFGDVNIA